MMIMIGSKLKIRLFCALLFLLLMNLLSAKPLELSGDFKDIHDPCIIQSKGYYYVFSTGKGLKISRSKDLIQWEYLGHVYDKLPKWSYDINPRIVDLWAPDISYYHGKYYLYYAASNFGENESAIGLATNVTLDPQHPKYSWKDEGIIYRTYRHRQDYNAIDPQRVGDDKGNAWMVFGSYWSGIKMVRLDEVTGKLHSRDTAMYSIAQRWGDTAIEAPCIIRHKRYYYLFVSYDHCCQGINSNYNIRVGRSKNITGPYIDKDENPMLHSGGSMMVEGVNRWKGPGHCAVLHAHNQDYLVYHSYDASNRGIPTVRINPIIWDIHDWPVVSGP